MRHQNKTFLFILLLFITGSFSSSAGFHDDLSEMLSITRANVSYFKDRVTLLREGAHEVGDRKRTSAADLEEKLGIHIREDDTAFSLSSILSAIRTSHENLQNQSNLLAKLEEMGSLTPSKIGERCSNLFMEFFAGIRTTYDIRRRSIERGQNLPAIHHPEFWFFLSTLTSWGEQRRILLQDLECIGDMMAILRFAYQHANKSAISHAALSDLSEFPALLSFLKGESERSPHLDEGPWALTFNDYREFVRKAATNVILDGTVDPKKRRLLQSLAHRKTEVLNSISQGVITPVADPAIQELVGKYSGRESMPVPLAEIKLEDDMGSISTGSSGGSKKKSKGKKAKRGKKGKKGTRSKKENIPPQSETKASKTASPHIEEDFGSTDSSSTRSSRSDSLSEGESVDSKDTLLSTTSTVLNPEDHSPREKLAVEKETKSPISSAGGEKLPAMRSKIKDAPKTLRTPFTPPRTVSIARGAGISDPGIDLPIERELTALDLMLAEFSSKHRSTLERIVATGRDSMKSLRYSTVSAALRHMGCFHKTSKAGSRELFISPDGHKLHIHSPHPSPNIGPYTIGDIASFLRSIAEERE